MGERREEKRRKQSQVGTGMPPSEERRIRIGKVSTLPDWHTALAVDAVFLFDLGPGAINFSLFK